MPRGAAFAGSAPFYALPPNSIFTICMFILLSPQMYLLVYPGATSSAIVMLKPAAKASVPRLKCLPCDISGISSSPPHRASPLPQSSTDTAVPEQSAVRREREAECRKRFVLFCAAAFLRSVSFCTRSRSTAHRWPAYTAAQSLSRRPLRSWCNPDDTWQASGHKVPAPSSACRCRTS